MLLNLVAVTVSGSSQVGALLISDISVNTAPRGSLQPSTPADRQLPASEASSLAASLEACSVGRDLMTPHHALPSVPYARCLSLPQSGLDGVLFLCDPNCKQVVLPSLACLYVCLGPSSKVMHCMETVVGAGVGLVWVPLLCSTRPYDSGAGPWWLLSDVQIQP